MTSRLSLLLAALSLCLGGCVTTFAPEKPAAPPVEPAGVKISQLLDDYEQVLREDLLAARRAATVGQAPLTR